MIGLLIFPVLVCGYIYITESPREQIRISLYHGWLLYIRAAKFGILIVAFVAALFGYLLPAIGTSIGHWTGITLLPDTHLFLYLANLMGSGLYPGRQLDPSTLASLQLASLSFCSIVLTWLTAFTCQRVNWLGAQRLRRARKRQVELLLEDKAPIEHQLITIKTQAKIDFAHNAAIYRARRDVLSHLRCGKIKRHDPEDRAALAAILKQLTYRQVTYALISLENDKVYIGLPTLLPEPDEESVISRGIGVIPVRSGYRDKRRRIVITGGHDFDLAAPLPTNTLSLTRDKIISISGFTFPSRPYPRLLPPSDISDTPVTSSRRTIR
ncbi:MULTISPECIES: hypothetical protein [unclassified Halomonas]|uniref:hypothetical protein n=1 Tax=unclassified Halomonas TaxID=2609666 RepID=UPI001C937730|nr:MULTISPECIES: hypothetical protein [unclassified Halomonas]MBY5925468.1 hypothetical protein [Halomonas sp. DP4Y7-2]MBY6232713.1 hypothetical protein [Halomonas sp. DP4Y7-1]